MTHAGAEGRKIRDAVKSGRPNNCYLRYGPDACSDPDPSVEVRTRIAADSRPAVQLHPILEHPQPGSKAAGLIEGRRGWLGGRDLCDSVGGRSPPSNEF